MKKDLSPVYDLIRADGSIVMNKALCFAIGREETMVYSELLARYNYFNTRDELDDEGYFFNTVNDFERATTLNDKEQKKAITKLERLGLIKTKLKGLPAKRHFLITDDLQLLLNYISLGKRKIDELEKTQKEETQKSLQKRKLREEERQHKANQLFSQNGGTCLDTDSKQDSPNQPSNNTNPNDTNLIILTNKEGFYQNEVREGYSKLEITTSNSIPFYDFLAGLLKRCKTDYRKEILESIIYYYSKYKEVLGEEHIRYKKDNCIEIISRIDTIYSIGIEDETLGIFHNDIDVEAFKSMVDKHFETKYKKMQYTLMSFLNDKVLKNRFYEACY